MLNPGLPEKLWSRLDGRLWHATKPKSLFGIISYGEIRVADGDRYQNSFCRCQGGVSLFDFGPSSVDLPTQFNNWRGWFGQQQEARIAIWLEIDRARSLECLSDAGATREQFGQSLSSGMRLISGVEACHRGPIPLIFIVSALLIARDNLELFQQCNELDFEIFQHIGNFEENLSSSLTQDPVVERLLAGRRRCAKKSEGE